MRLVIFYSTKKGATMTNIKHLKNVVYTQSTFEYHTADIYLPVDQHDAPLVIAVHGGAFQAGSKEMYSLWGKHLAENGIACMAINYTLATPTRAAYPHVINEMNEAIQFVVKHAHDWEVDPNKLGFMGDSAGAYLGTMAAFGEERSSAKIRFVISIYGVLDIVEWYHYTNQTRTDFVVNKLFGCDFDTSKALYLSASPIHQIEEATRNPMLDTSFYMLWGEDDDIVLPENQTIPFIAKLEKHRLYYDTQSIPGKGHFWFTKNDEEIESNLNESLTQEIAPKLLAFIKKITNNNKKSDPNSKED